MRKNLPPLFCNVGERVKFTKDLYSESWNEADGGIKEGDTYKIIDLVGFGWDLERIISKGPMYLRILNSEIQNYVVIVE